MRLNFLVLIAFVLLGTACTSVQNKDKSTEEGKIQGLISQMTLDEKIGQMQQLADGFYPNEDALKQAIRDGKVGSVLNVVGPERVAELQRVALKESKHGIPLP